MKKHILLLIMIFLISIVGCKQKQQSKINDIDIGGKESIIVLDENSINNNTKDEKSFTLSSTSWNFNGDGYIKFYDDNTYRYYEDIENIDNYIIGNYRLYKNKAIYEILPKMDKKYTKDIINNEISESNQTINNSIVLILNEIKSVDEKDENKLDESDIVLWGYFDNKQEEINLVGVTNDRLVHLDMPSTIIK